MNLEAKGFSAVRAHLEKAPEALKDDVDEELGAIAAEFQADVILEIQSGAKTGRVYSRGQRQHQSSGPGQTPASDYGTLIGSIYHEQEERMTWLVGSRLLYAAWLEYGTTKMAARPVWEKVKLMYERVIVRRLVRVIRGALR